VHGETDDGDGLVEVDAGVGVEGQPAGHADVVVEINPPGLDVDFAVEGGRVGGGEVEGAAVVELELSGADEGADREVDGSGVGDLKLGGSGAVFVVADLEGRRAGGRVFEEAVAGDQGRNDRGAGAQGFNQ